MMSRRANRGFSLLEVMVAFTILAMLLGALFQVFSSGMHAARSGERHTRATVIAQSRLAAVGVEYPPVEGVTSGASGDVFHWRVTVSPYSDDQPGPENSFVQPLAVDVEVFWEEGGTPRSVSLSSIVLRPASS